MPVQALKDASGTNVQNESNDEFLFFLLIFDLKKVFCNLVTCYLGIKQIINVEIKQVTSLSVLFSKEFCVFGQLLKKS